VVSVATLERDLLDWNALYLAGRMHKPVQTLARSPFIESAQQKNVQAALRAALLLLPEKFNAIELLRAICTLSYAGDFRMGIAEDAQKVDRIVQGRLMLAYLQCSMQLLCCQLCTWCHVNFESIQRCCPSFIVFMVDPLIFQRQTMECRQF
jgi:hypothetical protein